VRGVAHDPVLRAKLMALHEAGIPLSVLSERHAIARPVLSRWWARYQAQDLVVSSRGVVGRIDRQRGMCRRSTRRSLPPGILGGACSGSPTSSVSATARCSANSNAPGAIGCRKGLSHQRGTHGSLPLRRHRRAIPSALS